MFDMKQKSCERSWKLYLWFSSIYM